MRRGVDARRDPGQRGSAMLLVATILVALLAGGGVALYVQLQGTKSAGLVKASKNSLFCAEAGIIASRPTLALNYLAWPTLLDGNAANDPSWYPLRGDLDGDGVADYEVSIKDNDDEVPPAADDPLFDNDRRVFAVGRCLKSTEVSRNVMELLIVGGGGYVYRNQAGGGGWNTGNQNQ
jgi:hypothetical protein